MQKNNQIDWELFPKCVKCDDNLRNVIKVFNKNIISIDSKKNDLNSDSVLKIVRPNLESIGYIVEKSKLSSDKIKMPVLFGRNGVIDKHFEVDAYHESTKTVIEVEAGRGYTNYQFLKDIFEAAVMQDVDYCVIAVRRIYKGSDDFDKVCNFIDALYSSNRLKLPFKGLLIIGY